MELSRRRPDVAEARSSNLTKLTDQAVQTLNKGVRTQGSGLLSREKLEEAGLKKQPGDYLLMCGAVTFVGVVLGFLLGGPGLAVVMLVLTPVGLIVFLNLLVARRRKKFDEQVPIPCRCLPAAFGPGTASCVRSMLLPRRMRPRWQRN